MPSILYLLLRGAGTRRSFGSIYLDNGEMDFLHSGVADCTGWVIACSGGEGEGVRDSVEEIDDTLRACTYALGGGRLGVAERLRHADEDFRTLFTQV
jgi:hypothetical protein